MGMFSKVIAFLDKAAGVPEWIIHAENIRKLEGRGCPLLAKAIIDNEVLWPLASYSLEQMVPKLAGMVTIARIAAEADPSIVGSRKLVHEIIAAYEGPMGEDLQVLYDFVGKDIPSVEIVDVEVVLTDPEDTSMAEVVEEEEEGPEQTLSPTTAPDLDKLDTDAIPMDEAAKAQLLQGMMAVISRGRKPAPTLKVLNNMSMGDRSIVVEALSAMEAKGNTLAKAILEDPSL